ncbi:MAG: hypothetical protein HYZ92_02125 [Candidatus Omnitrophica bacterium]|nr:hypothetical protein [Candidatus Omnitrophota bacterium]
MRLTYRLEYSRKTERHLRALTARQRAVVFDAVNAQFAHQPTVETKNRKSMRVNPVAPWELRIGDLRVYYRVQEEPEQLVQVLAVGVKQRNRVWIAGEVIEL